MLVNVKSAMGLFLHLKYPIVWIPIKMTLKTDLTPINQTFHQSFLYHVWDWTVNS